MSHNRYRQPTLSTPWCTVEKLRAPLAHVKAQMLRSLGYTVVP